MMRKLKLVIIVAGCGLALAFNGFQEWSVSRGTSPDPDIVELADLEKSPDIRNNHLKLGEHIAIYTDCVYEYVLEDGESGEPTEETKVTHAYYPIISHDHPHMHAIDSIVEKYGDVDNVPDAEWPVFEKFTVLVKTGRFKTLGDIPDDWMDCATLQGLVINRIHSLDDEEKALLQDSFPSMDLDSVLILEEGRVPTSTPKASLMMGGGGVLILFGLGLFFIPKKKPAPSE